MLINNRNCGASYTFEFDQPSSPYSSCKLQPRTGNANAIMQLILPMQPIYIIA